MIAKEEKLAKLNRQLYFGAITLAAIETGMVVATFMDSFLLEPLRTPIILTGVLGLMTIAAGYKVNKKYMAQPY